LNNVRKLTEGAILLAAFTVLLLITIYAPVIGMIVNFVLPLPFILFAAKNDLKSILVFTVAGLLISFIAGTIVALPLTLTYGITGAVMGYLIQKNKSRTTILIAGSFIFLLSLIIQYVVSATLFHFNFIDELIKTMRDSLSTSSDILKGFGQQQESQKVLKQFEQALDLIKTLVPSLFVISSFVAVFFIQLLALPVLKRFGIKMENWKPFREISLPRSLLWYYLIVMLLQMVFHPQTGTYMSTALLNLSYILQLFMLFQGLTFIFYYFYRRGASKSLPVIIVVVSFVMPILLYIIGILGIIDLGFGLRKRNEKQV
jgi:uncharacterized protein YybS (DUF2232 family)